MYICAINQKKYFRMKKLRLLFVIVVFFTVLIKISSQTDTVELKKFKAIDTFKLKNYALPDLKYKSLGFGSTLNTNSNDSRSTYSSSSNIEDDNYTRFYFKSNLDLNRHSYTNSPNKQFSGWDYCNFNIDYTKLKEWDSTNTTKVWNLRPVFSSNRSYKHFNSKNYFLELTSDFFGMFGSYTTPFYLPFGGELIQIYQGTKNSYSLGFSPGIGIGKGRIEDVTDAWHTIRILKELEREKLLTDIPGSDQILFIAQRISEIKNERIFDGRIRRKENLKSLDDALFSTGLISERNIEYYNSLFDMWSYGIDFRRFTNWDIALHFAPLISFWDSDYKENDDKSIGSGFKAGISYNSYKPINMFWQFDLYASLDLNYIYDKYYYFNFNHTDIRGYLTPSLNAKLTNFISSRAYFSTSVNGHYNVLVFDDSDYEDYYSYGFSFKNSFVYYVSPMTSLNADLNFFYSFSKSEYSGINFYQGDGFSHTFNIGFNHYFY